MAARTAAVSPPRTARGGADAATRLKPVRLLALQACDAAVRLGSFEDAAEALHITSSTISHRIRNLEKGMGDALFTRAHRAVQVMPTGRRWPRRPAVRSAS